MLVAHVRVVGEYTNEKGQWGDDWFVLFVGSEGNWFEAPADVKNVEAVLGQLGERPARRG